MTNLTLNVVVLIVLILVSLPVLRRLRTWPVVCTVLHLSILTMVFDTLMINAGLYVFDPTKIVGIRIWGAPVEDFAYAAGAAVAMPVLWTVLARRTAFGGPGAADGDARRADDARPGATDGGAGCTDGGGPGAADGGGPGAEARA